MRIAPLATALIPLLVFAAFSFPPFAAAALVNINTASSAELETLTGIGPSKAATIIQYRTDHGPFSRIEDIQNVSGIGPSTYAGIAAFITVGSAPSPDPEPEEDTDANPAPPDTETTHSSSSKTAPRSAPTELTVVAGSDQTASVHVPLRLSARVTNKGNIVSTNHVKWNFGDGSLARGRNVEKTYHDAGSYLIMVDAVDDSATGHDEFVVTVVETRVRILDIGANGITIVNESNQRVDLSGWWIHAGEKSFPIPLYTILLPKAKIVFSFAVTKLPAIPAATLSYPDGMIVDRYPPLPHEPVSAALVQPLPVPESSSTVQVEEREVPLTSLEDNSAAHEPTQVSAPAAATQLAAAGAASPDALPAPAPAENSRGFWGSPWTWGGLVSILLLAGGSFIFL